jgi:hypothetical protein
MADIGEPVREVEIPEHDPLAVPEQVPAPSVPAEPVPA